MEARLPRSPAALASSCRGVTTLKCLPVQHRRHRRGPHNATAQAQPVCMQYSARCSLNNNVLLKPPWVFGDKQPSRPTTLSARNCSWSSRNYAASWSFNRITERMRKSRSPDRPSCGTVRARTRMLDTSAVGSAVVRGREERLATLIALPIPAGRQSHLKQPSEPQGAEANQTSVRYHPRVASNCLNLASSANPYDTSSGTGRPSAVLVSHAGGPQLGTRLDGPGLVHAPCLPE